MAETKNLRAQIPLDLHAKVSEAREQAGQSTAQYITNLITEYFEMKENGFQLMRERTEKIRRAASFSGCFQKIYHSE